jgi:hypothetical protein
MVITRIVGAAALFALSAGMAQATPVTIAHGVKVRSGPGTHYRVVARLPRGSVVDVRTCPGRWCEVAWRGGQGYVAATQIAGAGAPAVAVAPGPAYYDDYPGFEYPGYAYGPDVGVFVGPAWGHHYGGRWHHRNWGGGGWSGHRWSQAPIGGTPGTKASGLPRAPFAAGRAPSTVGSGTIGGGGFKSSGAPVASAPAAPAGAAPAPAPAGVVGMKR